MLVLLALAIRVGVVLADTGYFPAHDAYDYNRHALSIAAGDGYPVSAYVREGGPTALRAPAYPYLLGGIYALTGNSMLAGRLANAALGALAVLLLYLIMHAIWGRRVALVAAGMAAVFPPLVLLSRDLLTESLFVVFELGAVLCVLAVRRSGGALRWAAAAGALCGLAALTREVGLLLVIPVGIGAWVLRPRLRPHSLAPVAVVAASAALVVAPWTVRNAIEFGRFVPVASSTGFTLAGTYNELSSHDQANPAAWRSPIIVPEYASLFHTPGIDEGTLDATLRHEAMRFAWEHPAYVAEATGENLLRLFYLAGGSVIGLDGEPVNQRGIGSGSTPLEHLGLAVAVALALLGVYAIARSPRRPGVSLQRFRIPRGPWFLWLIPILLILAAAPLNGLPRYRAPADPFLLILAAIGLVWVWDRVRAVRSSRTAGAKTLAAALLGLGLIALSGCGGQGGASGTTVPQLSSTPPAHDLSRDRYVARANAVCRGLTNDARRLSHRLFTGSTPEDLLNPAVRLLSRQASRLRELSLPTENTAMFRLYVRLYDPLEELVRERAQASARGDIGRAHELDPLITGLAAEQRRIAARADMHSCNVDFGRVFLGAGKSN